MATTKLKHFQLGLKFKVLNFDTVYTLLYFSKANSSAYCKKDDGEIVRLWENVEVQYVTD